MEMACYSFNVSIIGRSYGGSIVSAAAYANGSRLNDKYYGGWYDYSARQDVLYTDVLLPVDAPARLRELQTFLDELNASERRKDSQLAQSIILALPLELSFEEQIALLENFCYESFVSKGRCANMAVHSGTFVLSRKPDSFPAVCERRMNPHAHLLIPFRGVDSTGFLKRKVSSNWHDRTADLISLRESWAIHQNRALERAGFDTRVTHESYAARGIAIDPTRHVGAAAIANELKGVPTRLLDDHLRVIAARQSQERDRNAIEAILQQRTEQRERERMQTVALQHARDRELLREKDQMQGLEREHDCRDFSRER